MSLGFAKEDAVVVRTLIFWKIQTYKEVTTTKETLIIKFGRI